MDAPYDNEVCVICQNVNEVKLVKVGEKDYSHDFSTFIQDENLEKEGQRTGKWVTTRAPREL